MAQTTPHSALQTAQPNQIKDVDGLISKYACKEEELFTKACGKYGVPYKSTVLYRGNRRVVVTWYKPDET